MALNLCSLFFFFNFLYKEMWTDTHTHTHFHLSCTRHYFDLKAAERRHVLRLLAGDAPVVGLVDRLVVFPYRLVVHGEPLDGFRGKCLTGNIMRIKLKHNVRNAAFIYRILFM